MPLAWNSFCKKKRGFYHAFVGWNKYRRQATALVFKRFPYSSFDTDISDEIVVIPSYVNNTPVHSVSIFDTKNTRIVICPLNTTSVLNESPKIEHIVLGRKTKELFLTNGRISGIFCEGTEELTFYFEYNRYIRELVISGYEELGTFGDKEPLSLINIYSLCELPPFNSYCGNFLDLDKEWDFVKHGILHVPEGTKRYYQATRGWNRINNIEELSTSDKEAIIDKYRQKDLTVLRKAEELKWLEQYLPEKKKTVPPKNPQKEKRSEPPMRENLKMK